MNRFVYGILWDEPSATQAFEALEDAHFDPRDISLFVWKGPTIEQIPIELKTGVKYGAVFGAAIGVVIGSLLAWAGIVDVTSLFGAVALIYVVGVAGMLLGGVLGLGHWRDRPRFPADHNPRGDVVVGVSTVDRVGLAEDILHDLGASEVRTQSKWGAIEELVHRTDAA